LIISFITQKWWFFELGFLGWVGFFLGFILIKMNPKKNPTHPKNPNSKNHHF
jgi:hypothetical protein